MRKFGFLLLSLILLACVPTPAEDVVAHKNTALMVETALSSDSKAEEAIPVPESLHVEKEFKLAHSGIPVTIDADIVLPSAEKLPLAHIRKGVFSEDFLHRVIHVIGNDSKPINIFPKSYYQEIANGLITHRDNGDLDKYDSVEEINRAILKVLAQADAAPEEPVYSDRNPATEHDSLFSEPGGDPTLSDFWISDYCGLSENGTIFHMMLSSRRLTYFREVSRITEFENAIGFQNPIHILQPLIDQGQVRVNTPQRTMEDAKAEALRLMEDLQLSPDFTLTHARIAPIVEWVAEARERGDCEAVYEFLFTRQINGVNITYTNDLQSNASAKEAPEEAVQEQWEYERVRVYIDDQGLLAFYYDGSPYEILEMTSDAVTVLPLDEAVSIFEKQLGFVYADSIRRVQIEHPSIRITEIWLGLTRVLEQNAERQAYLVPSWTFFGIEHMTSYNNMVGFEGYGFDGTTAILTINAVDGSVIDRQAGY